MICGVRLSASRLADDDDLDRALGAQLGHRLEQVREALHRDVARCRAQDAAGHALHVGHRLEHVGVDADRHHVHAIERHTEVVMDVDLRRLAHRHHVIHLPGHDSCIRTNEYQRRVPIFFHNDGACSSSSRRSTLIG